MRKFKYWQFPFLALWLLKRYGRYFFWSVYNRFGIPPKFARVGKRVRFHGPVRVEHPFSKIEIGDFSSIGTGCYFLAKDGGKIAIGKNVFINDRCYITSLYGIEIGEHVCIAEHVSIRDYDHAFEDTGVPIAHQGFKGAPIRIEEDVWIGRGVMITSGVTIGKGSIIGANAVVTKDIPAWSIAVGAPAKVIKSRVPA